jgi:hypothetical protein
MTTAHLADDHRVGGAGRDGDCGAELSWLDYGARSPYLPPVTLSPRMRRHDVAGYWYRKRGRRAEPRDRNDAMTAAPAVVAFHSP